MSKLRERFEAWHEHEHGWIPEWDESANRYVTEVEHSRYVAYRAALEPVRELVEKETPLRGAVGYDPELAYQLGWKDFRDELAKLLEDK